ncbi:uncharacterized protein K452DRAFT_362590 [Aplosporella prunicola CBS 121167]|uniref:Phosphatidic acid phosphatase type 2/haloperoxidase domain-containing protein n=1 Tax=Aplosporella prunicola CBS 121167 TaxID=1176127 RepID=A0A6A6AX57_9PEZI|nr:uncharacterized protein K452DRAFT_362590 [Aplosporella prunicola CBS 121167]KAF2136330.1 hypothetical protein K452DRAFT_362590 [Aplosporella prunicola CBS 121167]
MGLFSRNTRPADANTAHSTGSTAPANGHHAEKTGRHHTYGDGSFNRRPPFGQWLKTTWLDILTMAVMGAIGLGVYQADPAPSRSFPVYFEDGQVVYPDFAYPRRHEIIPIWAAALLAALVPIAIFFICQIRIRSFWDLNNSIIGLLYSLITAAVFQVFVKWLIGGLRPHFYDVCKPAVPLTGAQTGNGLKMLFYDRSVCTGDPSAINDSLESMPSGHTTAAFAGFVYLSLYLNAKLKVCSNYHPAMWKLIAVMAPLLAATLIGGALTIDKFHNWYDVVAGAVIGTLMAFTAYRMVYASVWDFRFNHVPLVRHAPFTYGGGEAAAPFMGFHDAMWTRKAGWGTMDGLAAIGGAPFDATAASGGLASAAGAASGYGHGHGHGYGHGAGTGNGVRHSIERRPVGGTAPPEHMV